MATLAHQPATRRHARELVVHLTQRDLISTHRFTVLGWLWPLVRQLAQLGVLVFLFSHIVDLGVGNYAVFVFSGLIAWSWFARSVEDATSSLLSHRHLVFQPRFPPAVLPVVAVAVAFVDVLIALPVLIAMLAVTGDISWKLVLLPVAFLVQFVLTCGIGLLTSSLTVYLRDIRGLVSVALTLLFYLTPVFYDAERVPDKYEWVLRLNPLTTLMDVYRWLMLDGSPFPSAIAAVALVASSGLAVVLGAFVFGRLQGGLVDEL
jgi:homopolymeric O-antigen transport system permease protein